jgi:hypothetical protein
MWTCDVCETTNETEATVCAVCGTAREGDTPPAAAATTTGWRGVSFKRLARVAVAYVVAVCYAILLLMLVPAIWVSYPQALLHTLRTQPYLVVAAVVITTLAFILCYLNPRFPWVIVCIIVGLHVTGLALALRG